MTNRPNGCLAAILALFGLKLGSPAEAEVSFYRVLANGIGSRAVVLAKVNLADIFFVVRPNENRAHRNRIDRKHVDFLLCDPATMKPLCAVERNSDLPQVQRVDGRASREERGQRWADVLWMPELSAVQGACGDCATVRLDGPPGVTGRWACNRSPNCHDSSGIEYERSVTYPTL
jgi:hypothetical protein